MKLTEFSLFDRESPQILIASNHRKERIKQSQFGMDPILVFYFHRSVTSKILFEKSNLYHRALLSSKSSLFTIFLLFLNTGSANCSENQSVLNIELSIIWKKHRTTSIKLTSFYSMWKKGFLNRYFFEKFYKNLFQHFL